MHVNKPSGLIISVDPTFSFLLTFLPYINVWGGCSDRHSHRQEEENHSIISAFTHRIFAQNWGLTPTTYYAVCCSKTTSVLNQESFLNSLFFLNFSSLWPYVVCQHQFMWYVSIILNELFWDTASTAETNEIQAEQYQGKGESAMKIQIIDVKMIVKNVFFKEEKLGCKWLCPRF